MAKVIAICRPVDQFTSLRAQAVNSSITLKVGNLKPGADSSVRGHADVVQCVEFDGMTADEAKGWMSQNGYTGTIKAPPIKKKAAKKVKLSS